MGGTTDGPADHKKKLANMQWVIRDEPLSSLATAPRGQSYTNTGGGPLMQRLRKLDKEQELQKEEHERNELRIKELERESANLRHLRRATTSARQQFFTQARLRRKGEKLGIRERNDTRQGNHSAHRGDLITDVALFEIGELSDHKESRRLYGVEATEALSIGCTSIIDAMNKRASILAEDENAWLADAKLETSFQAVLNFGRTASSAALKEFEEDGIGITDVAQAWFQIMDLPYPPPPKPAPCLKKELASDQGIGGC